ncbi:MAG: hypothetical protein VYB54_02155 [Pseudomonadota bacterium]|nr:hypothetical protein [Pseudomonadota bacterium]
MRRWLIIAAMVLGAGPALAQQAQQGAAQATPTAAEQIRAFVERNRKAHAQRTEEIRRELDAADCPLPTGLAADGLPEPPVIRLTLTRPQEFAGLAPGEHFDPDSVRVEFGGPRFAMDATTASLLNLPDGLPVRITATAFRVQDAICVDRRRETGGGRSVTRDVEVRISRKTGMRTADITGLLGTVLDFTGVDGITLDRDRKRLSAGQPGKVTLPRLVGDGARFQPVDCNGVPQQRFVGDTRTVNPNYVVRGGRADAVEAVGLVGLKFGDTADPGRQHMIVGPGATVPVYLASLRATIIDALGQRDVDTGPLVPSPVEIRMERSGPFGVTLNRGQVEVRPLGVPGEALFSLRPAGSTEGARTVSHSVTASRARIVLSPRRGFVDEPFVAGLAIEGPMPAGSGHRVAWRLEVVGQPVQSGEVPLGAGGSVTNLPLAPPPAAEVIRRAGMVGRLSVRILSAEGNELYGAVDQVQFVAPPVTGLDVLARPAGGSGEFTAGTVDLFRAERSRGVELMLRLALRGGLERFAQPGAVPAVGLQPTRGGGLRFVQQTQRALVDAMPGAAVGQAKLRAFLRPGTAETEPFGLAPGAPELFSSPLEFTLNDTLLLVEELGRHGAVWRLLVDGPADMTAYRARFDSIGGPGEPVAFRRDGATSWVAEHRILDERAVIRFALIVDAAGNEVARLDRFSAETLVPRVSLDVPEIYRQGVRHRITATISGIEAFPVADLGCRWELQPGFGAVAAGSSPLRPIGSGFASCETFVTMDVNPETLGRFPELNVRLFRIGGEAR